MPTTDDRIRYLVRLQYPEYLVILEDIGREGHASLPEMERRKEIEAYLSDLPENQLNSLYAHHKEAEETDRRFNRPRAMAKFNHWSKAAQWSLDEAIALSLGREPMALSWHISESTGPISNFALLYYRRHDLTLRAKAQNHLTDPVKPGRFLG